MEFGFKAEDIIKERKVTQNELDQIYAWAKSAGFPHIPPELMVSFILSCSNDYEETQKTIEAYFRTRNDAPEIFSERNIDDPALQICLATQTMLAIPQRTDEGHTIVFFRMEDSSYSKFNILSQAKITTMLLDAHVQQYPSAGLITIIDMQQFTIRLLPKISLSVLTKLQRYVQEGLPMKICEVHILNANSLFHYIMNVFKFCMSKDLISKFKLHSKCMDMEEFFKTHIPAKCMPSDYGGLLPSLFELRKDNERRMRNLQAYFKEDDKLRQLYKP